MYALPKHGVRVERRAIWQLSGRCCGELWYAAALTRVSLRAAGHRQLPSSYKELQPGAAAHAVQGAALRHHPHGVQNRRCALTSQAARPFAICTLHRARGASAIHTDSKGALQILTRCLLWPCSMNVISLPQQAGKRERLVAAGSNCNAVQPGERERESQRVPAGSRASPRCLAADL